MQTGYSQDDWDYLKAIASLTATAAAKEHGFDDTVVTDAIAIAVLRKVLKRRSISSNLNANYND